jgi:type IV secretory pathway VirB2 component (pilin)
MKKKLNAVLMCRSLWVFLVFTCVVVLTTTNAFAVGEQIASSLNQLLDWVTKILGGIAVAFGVAFTGIRMAMGDENALKRGGYIVGGGIVIFSSMYIVQMLQAIFK